MNTRVFVALSLALACTCDTNLERIHWPAAKDWRAGWSTEEEKIDVTVPTAEEWEGIGDFYTYDEKYMLQMRKNGTDLQYRIHYHVDKHADGALMEEMRVLSSHGYARVFGPRYDRALQYVYEATGTRWQTWDQLDACAQDPDCSGAWAPHPNLMDQNSTILRVIHAVPAELTVRCHNHENGLWCHNRVLEFNQGFFYVVEVQADNDPTRTYRACVMCHDWPEAMSQQTGLNPPHCHSTPIDGVVVIGQPSFWESTRLPSATHVFAPDGFPDPFLFAPGNAVPTSDDWKMLGEMYTYPEQFMLQVDKDGMGEVQYKINFDCDAKAAPGLQQSDLLTKFGFARNFVHNRQAALEFIMETTGHYFRLWPDMKTCGHVESCQHAWSTDAKLMGKNTTIVDVKHAIPAELTVRCHEAADHTVWCHNRVKEFNEGMFYVVEVQANDEPERTRIGAVMCHDWPEAMSHQTNLNPAHCHSLPVDAIVAVVQPSLWDKVEVPPAKNMYDYLPENIRKGIPTHQMHHHHTENKPTEKADETIATNNEALNGRQNYVRLRWPGAEEWRKTWDGMTW